MIKHLTDRPCAVCEFHKENGCSKWSCVFEQEPTTKNDLGVDCISRADALDCVNIGITFCDVYKKINDLPAITPQEPRKGHWIEHGIDESYAIPVYTCSECDHFIGVVVSNFCPNCGADMRADRSEEE